MLETEAWRKMFEASHERALEKRKLKGYKKVGRITGLKDAWSKRELAQR